MTENKALSTSIEGIQLNVLFKYVYLGSISGRAAVYAKYIADEGCCWRIEKN